MHGGRLVDLITRHFLAVCSDDAIGFETVVTLECATETFTCTRPRAIHWELRE